MNPFEEIKARVSILNYIKVDKAGKALCPFHKEKSASFSVYEEGRKFHCFGCGVSGSVIDFVALTYSIRAADAAKLIDEQFGLGLFNRQLSAREREEIKKRREIQEIKKKIRQERKALAGEVLDIVYEYSALLDEYEEAHVFKWYNYLFDTCENYEVQEMCRELSYIKDYEDIIEYYKENQKKIENYNYYLSLYGDSKYKEFLISMGLERQKEEEEKFYKSVVAEGCSKDFYDSAIPEVKERFLEYLREQEETSDDREFERIRGEIEGARASACTV